MNQQDTVDSRLIKCAEYIKQNRYKNISLTELSEKTTMSRYHFQRQFSAMFGVSPKQFQSAIKIQKLKQSLKGEGRSQKTVGFCSLVA